MLDLAGQVTEAKVDELVPLVGDEGQDVGSRLAHGAPFGWVAKRERGVFSPFPVSMPLPHRERCVSAWTVGRDGPGSGRQTSLSGGTTLGSITAHSQSLCLKM